MSLLQSLSIAALVVVMAVASEWFLATMYGEDEVSCAVSSLPIQLDAVPEASGIAHSARHADLFWTFNDSGEPILFGVDSNGDVRASVRVANATIANWEDISAGPCPAGSCLYVADIGDNKSRRSSVRVYRVAEPRLRDRTTQSADVFEGRFPDGPHDAEAAFVLPDGRLFVITRDKFATVYRFPLQAGTVATLEKVAMLPLDHVTDADASPDGTRIVVRTKQDVVFYRTSELLAGDIEHGEAVPTAQIGEPQGEGVTFGPEHMVVLAGEGGGPKHARKPGTLAMLQCRFADHPTPGIRAGITASGR